MLWHTVGFLAILALSGAPSSSVAESGVAVVPAGMTTVDALLTVTESLFRQEGFTEITVDRNAGTLHVSRTLYNTISVGRAIGGIQADTVSWNLELRQDGEGRIVATIHWDSSPGQEQNAIPKLVANITAGALLNSARIALTYQGETYSVLEWGEKAREPRKPPPGP
jgi:hypothetical protein